MQFTATALTLFVSLAMCVAVPDAAAGHTNVAQRLDAKRLDAKAVASGDMIFGRSITCPSNDPSICCAVCCYLPLFSTLLRTLFSCHETSQGCCTCVGFVRRNFGRKARLSTCLPPSPFFSSFFPYFQETIS